jgi:hypothetical protein
VVVVASVFGRLSIRRCLGSVFLLPLPVDKDDTDWSLVAGDELPDGEVEIGFILLSLA